MSERFARYMAERFFVTWVASAVIGGISMITGAFCSIPVVVLIVSIITKSFIIVYFGALFGMCLFSLILKYKY